MASKKSKILAIAFCAAVMSGIYVNPVLAKNVSVNEHGNVTITPSDFDNRPLGQPDSVTITGIASQEAVEDAQQTANEAQQTANEAQQTANEVAADVKTIQTNDQNQNNRLDIYESQIGALQESDKKQNETLADHETAIGALELENDKQDSAIAGLDALLKERQKADADLQDQIDGHTNQIDSMGDQLDDLKTKDEAQDATLEGHTNQINSMGTQLDDLKANDELQDADIDKLQENDAVQDADIDKLQENDAIQDDILDAHGQQIGDNTAAIKNHTSVIGVEDNSQLKNEYADTNYISGANDMVEADVILDREISNVNSRVDGLENRVDGLEDRIDKVGAMSAAIANLRTMGYDPAAPTEVAVGVGQYRDETGMALGLFHYPNRDFMLSLSVSTSGDEYMGGIGATWKFGRKSPEKVAEIKKAQAEADARRAEEQKLAKAEEMKKAAKEAKVQAQMERHAKMLAEQEAQAEA